MCLAKDKIGNDYTVGSIPKHLLNFSVPFFISNLLQACYGAVDSIVVGHAVGSAGTSAVGVGAQLMVLISAACSGLCMGGTVVLGQHRGAKDEQGQEDTISTFFGMVTVTAITLSLAGLILSPVAVRALNTPAEAEAQAIAYLRICCGGIIFIFGYNSVCAVFRGLGNSKYPMYFVMIAAVANVALDLIFVVFLKMESSGAALATVLSQALSFFIALAFLARQDDGVIRAAKRMKIFRGKLALILRTGIPSMTQTLVTNTSFLIVASMINGFGIAASAVCGIGSRLTNFFMLLRQAIAMSVGGIVAQNMGAEKPERAASAVRLGVIFSLGFTFVLFAIINVFPASVISIFNTEPEVIAEGIRYIHIVSFCYLFMAPMTVYNNLAIGVGKSSLSLAFSFTDSIIVRVPLCYIFMSVCGLGLTGVYIGMAISPLSAALMGFCYFHFGSWRSIKFIKK